MRISKKAYSALRAQLIYVRDPVAWCEDVAGAHLWSKMEEILNSIRDNRLTAVHACFASSKTTTAALATCWWVSCHPPGEAMVVTTASTFRQVRALLWREINKVHARANLSGSMNQTEWWLPVQSSSGQIRDRLVAFGCKPTDSSQEGFQGIHEGYVLFIGDEASSLSDSLCIAGRSAAANDASRFVLIGNPVGGASYFRDKCLPGSGFNVVHISYKDTPNFTGEDLPEHIKQKLIGRSYLEEMKLDWGEDHPTYIERCLGQFSTAGDGAMIRPEYITEAVDRCLDGYSGPLNVLGVDVGATRDQTVIAHNNRGRVKIVFRSAGAISTMESLGEIVKALQSTGADCARVDSVGVGIGVVDRAKEIADNAVQRRDQATVELYKKIIGVNVGGRPSNPLYLNLRSEGLDTLRRLLEHGEISLVRGVSGARKELLRQMSAVRRKPQSSGKEAAMSKQEMLKRGLISRSSDELDAVVLSVVGLPEDKSKRRLPGVVMSDKTRRAVDSWRRA